MAKRETLLDRVSGSLVVHTPGTKPWINLLPAAARAECEEVLAAWRGGQRFKGVPMRSVARAIHSHLLAAHPKITPTLQTVEVWLRKSDD